MAATGVERNGLLEQGMIEGLFGVVDGEAWSCPACGTMDRDAEAPRVRPTMRGQCGDLFAIGD
jgi:hypothetical protein